MENSNLHSSCLSFNRWDNTLFKLSLFFGLRQQAVEMKIKYKKKRFKQNLIFGIVWTILGFLNLQYIGENNWLDYGFLLVAMLYWISYFYEKSYQYLTIDNDWIMKNSPFGKKINLSEVNRIKKFAGDYILKTDKKEMTINTEVIDEKSLEVLDRTLEKLDLPSDKTPFATIS